MIYQKELTMQENKTQNKKTDIVLNGVLLGHEQ